MTSNLHNQTALQWKWVVFSVIVGLAIVSLSYFIISPTFQSGEVQILVMLVGFIISGAIIGYKSPGITINEATIGGVLVAIIMISILVITQADLHYSMLINILLLILGVGFSWVGGWAGEKLQGDDSSAEEARHNKFLWKWVLVGTIIGFALNILLVFLLATILLPKLFTYAFIGFILSFVTTGFIVGYKSPGVTLKEPAVAGLLSVIIDWVFIEFIITLTVPVTYLVVGLAIGFLISLFGAWLGEKLQESAKSNTAV